MSDVSHLMETPVQVDTIFRCTKPGCGCEVQVIHVPQLPVTQPFACVCEGEMEQVSTNEPVAGG